MNDAPHYTIEIKWSDEDSRYVVILPSGRPLCHPVADGATYEEALRAPATPSKTSSRSRGRMDPLPEPATYASSPRS